MTNDSSYKIRLEILQMARDLIKESYEKECCEIQCNWKADCETARNKKLPIPKIGKFPRYPSEDDIIKKAEKLNKFISNK